MVAAYQGKGAASYGDSKVNLAGDSTHNLTEGNAPAWDTLIGWTMNGINGLKQDTTDRKHERICIYKRRESVCFIGSYSGNNTTRFVLSLFQGKKTMARWKLSGGNNTVMVLEVWR